MMERQKTFVTVFPNYSDFHFYKDPGQIPFRLSKLGYKSSIVCYSDGRPLPDTEPNIDLVRIKNASFSRRLNAGIISWLACHSKSIDILNLYHFSWQSLLFAFVYKLFNRKGFTYLKLDASRRSGIYSWENIFLRDKRPAKGEAQKGSFRNRLKNLLIKKTFVKKIDLWSVEDDYTSDAYRTGYGFFKDKLITLFNGHVADMVAIGRLKTYDEKENIILTVGRLGTEQKATDLLLESFCRIAGECNYTLHLAGSVEPSFNDFISEYFDRNPHLADRVFFHGELEKGKLMDLYNRSKIFCLPSRYEGLAIVFPEAMYFRNVIVTSPYVSPAGLIMEEGLGIVVDDLTGASIAEALLSVIEDQEGAAEFADKAHSFSKARFDWNVIVTELDREIKKRTAK